jgi:hypothetical protein
MKFNGEKPNFGEMLAPSVALEKSTFRESPDRLALIAATAYFKAEGRGFIAGSELEDWLAAEAEIDARQAH